MTERVTTSCQTEVQQAQRLLKAVKRAGFSRARLTWHPDGHLEIEGDDGESSSQSSILEKVESQNPWDELNK
ncbi:hypothetical protein ACT6QG_13265 [Xanthobacter sp. TB0136]|uniref:hypothetical protein n=1 Tax=Xanthobacter sp. TB0136 TaxID=3459177 RepID=UPI00403A42AB